VNRLACSILIICAGCAPRPSVESNLMPLVYCHAAQATATNQNQPEPAAAKEDAAEIHSQETIDIREPAAPGRGAKNKNDKVADSPQVLRWKQWGKAAGPRLIYFTAPGCAPCRKQEQILDKMAGQLDGITCVKLGSADAARWGVRVTPTIILVDAFNVVQYRAVGLILEGMLSKQLKRIDGSAQ